MNNQNIIIFKFENLYKILKQIEFDLNLDFFSIANEMALKQKLIELENSLVLTKKKSILIVINLYLTNTQLKYLV